MPTNRTVLATSVALAAGLIATAVGAQTPPDGAAGPVSAIQQGRTTEPALLLVNGSNEPVVRVQWTDKSGKPIIFEASRPYAGDAERSPLGGNISCYAAIGGTRLTKGAGHHRGAIVRVGFYKIDNAKPFFTGVTAETEFTITLAGVHFNQPVSPNQRSVVQHLKYDRGDLQACGLPGDAREQFNTADPSDTLNDRIRPGIDARLGVLDGGNGSLGSTTLTVAEDGSVTMTMAFRYPALRNLRDPWKSDLPGTFLEPYHFHAEFEVLPLGVAPLDPARTRDTKIDEPAD